jgi:hypothetical protein
MAAKIARSRRREYPAGRTLFAPKTSAEPPGTHGGGLARGDENKESCEALRLNSLTRLGEQRARGVYMLRDDNFQGARLLQFQTAAAARRGRGAPCRRTGGRGAQHTLASIARSRCMAASSASHARTSPNMRAACGFGGSTIL